MQAKNCKTPCCGCLFATRFRAWMTVPHARRSGPKNSRSKSSVAPALYDQRAGFTPDPAYAWLRSRTRRDCSPTPAPPQPSQNAVSLSQLRNRAARLSCSAHPGRAFPPWVEGRRSASPCSDHRGGCHGAATRRESGLSCSASVTCRREIFLLRVPSPDRSRRSSAASEPCPSPRPCD